MNTMIQALPNEQRALAEQAIEQVKDNPIGIRQLANDTRTRLFDGAHPVVGAEREMALAILTTCTGLQNGNPLSEESVVQNSFVDAPDSADWETRRAMLIKEAERLKPSNPASAERIFQSVVDGDVENDRINKDEKFQEIKKELQEEHDRMIADSMKRSEELAESASSTPDAYHVKAGEVK